MRFTSLLATLASFSLAMGEKSFPNTAERIAGYNYPAETHSVETADGYILTMFRIPYSPKMQNADEPNKPIVFLQHGFVSTSDVYILGGPDNALAFLAADAGYDVWLGNSRGNTYSEQNVRLSPKQHEFWDFSFHEIGIYDYPAMFEYALNATGQRALHYVGHSQGTTSFLVLMSEMPQYHDIIKTSHLLAPVVFMNHVKSPIIRLTAPLVGKPSPLSAVVSDNSFAMHRPIIGLLGDKACQDGEFTQIVCANLLFSFVGFDPVYLNYTLLPDFYETQPAGSSINVALHYIQEFKSGHFRQYDYGKKGNLKRYQQEYPPDYIVERVRPQVPVQLYYADNDFFSSPIDVLRLADRMGDNAQLHHVPYPIWNHLDYMLAINVREVIYDKVISLANQYELNEMQNYEEEQKLTDI